MSNQVSCCCDSCNARLRVSLPFLGRTGCRPSCGHKMTVRVPEAEGPMLVGDDGPV